MNECAMKPSEHKGAAKQWGRASGGVVERGEEERVKEWKEAGRGGKETRTKGTYDKWPLH